VLRKWIHHASAGVVEDRDVQDSALFVEHAEILACSCASDGALEMLWAVTSAEKEAARLDHLAAQHRFAWPFGAILRAARR
jgi:hypothetical protein